MKRKTPTGQTGKETPMKVKKASLLTKLVVLALLIGSATGLLTMRSQLQNAQADLARDKLGLVEPGEYVFRFTD